MARILNLVYLISARAFNRWALSEIDPLHPDLPRLVMRSQELEDQAKQAFGTRARTGSAVHH